MKNTFLQKVTDNYFDRKILILKAGNKIKPYMQNITCKRIETDKGVLM